MERQDLCLFSESIACISVSDWNFKTVLSFRIREFGPTHAICYKFVSHEPKSVLNMSILTYPAGLEVSIRLPSYTFCMRAAKALTSLTLKQAHMS